MELQEAKKISLADFELKETIGTGMNFYFISLNRFKITNKPFLFHYNFPLEIKDDYYMLKL